MATGKKVFIVGPGFIGWSVLEELVKEGYEVTALVRRPEAAEKLKASGAAHTVLGDINDRETITAQVLEHDVVIHAASADHAASAEAVLAGVQQRADQGKQTIYLHTSGTGVLGTGEPGQRGADGGKVFHDNVAAEVDSVPDDAPHRRIDLNILAVQRRLLQAQKAKIAIVMPPLIYGYNPQHQRLSIQVPTLTRYALKHGFAAHVGAGEPLWSTVHVRDLARGYVTILRHLENQQYGSPELANPYYFAENGDETTWRDIAALIGAELHQRGLVADPAPRTLPPETYGDLFGDSTAGVVGLNSRSRAERLRALGWKPVEKDWRRSFAEDELPAILRERAD